MKYETTKPVTQQRLYVIMNRDNMKLLQTDINISEFSNFRTPATARWYFEVNSESDVEQLKDIVDFAKSENLQILFIG